MRIHLVVWAGLALLALGSLTGMTDLSSAGSTTGLVDSERHYRAELTLAPVTAVQVVEAARQNDYWVRIQTGSDVTYFDGNTLCTTCSTGAESTFFESPQLIVDGQRFWVRLEEESWMLDLRPHTESPMVRYEIIVTPVLPKTDLLEEDVTAINTALAPLGVLAAPLTLDNFTQLIPDPKQQPPDGVRVDSTLYAMSVAPDWKEAAMTRGIQLSGLRVRVLVELAEEDATLPEELDLVVESTSTNFARVQVMIHRLEELASHPSVAFVRLPSNPQPAGQ